MSSGTELSDFFLPSYSTGGETEAQTCVGWYLPFRTSCSTTGFLEEVGVAYNDKARVGKQQEKFYHP